MWGSYTALFAVVAAVVSLFGAIEVVNATDRDSRYWMASGLVVAAIVALLATAVLMVAPRLAPVVAWLLLTFGGLAVVVGYVGYSDLLGGVTPGLFTARISMYAGLAAWATCTVPAIRAYRSAQTARYMRKALKSPDGLWWWDGLRWQPTGKESGRSLQHP